jgi:hypothetical protein
MLVDCAGDGVPEPLGPLLIECHGGLPFAPWRGSLYLPESAGRFHVIAIKLQGFEFEGGWITAFATFLHKGRLA